MKGALSPGVRNDDNSATAGGKNEARHLYCQSSTVVRGPSLKKPKDIETKDIERTQLWSTGQKRE